ncbi:MULTISPECIES: hypothetical protein [unclassified Clostridium]|uniref:hypothetical protein n=1 Tax=unclassified Clostridium TaxID=2614128 RepID=UPI001896F6F6|nr:MULTISPECIES: hypothetical protein [unclassified Clostridium]MBP3915338.1 hypothetical protein [Clostridium sp.]
MFYIIFLFFRVKRGDIDSLYNNEIRSSKYLPEIGEVLVEYEGVLEGDNYEIIYYDYTNTVSMYSENSFNVDLK